MHEALERTGWKLMLAGALAGATSAATLAQSLPGSSTGSMDVTQPEPGHGRTVALVGTPNGPPHLKIKNGTGATTQEAIARVAEIKAELAWLADPATCPCPLKAHAFGLTLEVRGSVPNEAVRAQAIALAKEQTTLAVMDALQVQPDLAMPKPINEPAENLALSAASAFNDSVPSYCFGVNIGALSNGTITVEGMIPSYEEKLRVSQRLRQLRGCTCVVNHLTVTALQRDGQPSAQVTTDGRLWVPAEPSATQLNPSKPALPLAQSPRTPFQAGPPVAVQRERPNGVVAWFKDKLGLGMRVSEPEESTASASGMSRSRWAATQPAPLPIPQASQWSSATPVATAVPNVPLSPYAGFPKDLVMPLATDTPTATGSLPAVASVYAPIKTLPTPTVTSSAPVVRDVPAPMPRTVAETTKPAQPVVQVVDWKANEPVLPPAMSLPSPAAPKSAVAAIEHTEPALPAPAKAAVAQVKQRVLAACGKSARDVEVIARSNVNLLIRLKVPDVAMGEQLGPQILALPDLEPYQVDLEIQIQR
jgi:hypothetical protein